jgi:hypothetical protein
MCQSLGTDYLLWAALAAGILVALGFVDVFPGKWGSRLGAQARALAAG